MPSLLGSAAPNRAASGVDAETHPQGLPPAAMDSIYRWSALFVQTEQAGKCRK